MTCSKETRAATDQSCNFDPVQCRVLVSTAAIPSEQLANSPMVLIAALPLTQGDDPSPSARSSWRRVEVRFGPCAPTLKRPYLRVTDRASNHVRSRFGGVVGSKFCSRVPPKNMLLLMACFFSCVVGHTCKDFLFRILDGKVAIR